MVLKPTNGQQAKVTANAIRQFRERKRWLELEMACLDGMINELEAALMEYREEKGLKPGQPNE